MVVPVYDERDNLEPLHRELDAALSELPGGVEFVYVDDGSRDDSAAVLGTLAKRDRARARAALRREPGPDRRLPAGFEAARGEIVATLDADLQNDPADLPKLLAALDRADVVNGVRMGRQDGFVRKLSSRIGNGFRNWLTHESVTDVGCSLRVMRAEYLKRVKLYRGMHRFLPTLLRMEGARVDRAAGEPSPPPPRALEVRHREPAVRGLRRRAGGALDAEPPDRLPAGAARAAGAAVKSL